MSGPIDSQLVTIDRAYFDTLVRRANFVGYYLPRSSKNSLSEKPSSNLHLKNRDDILAISNISIPKLEYEDLKRIADSYANLRRNLVRGGVDGATIDLLTQDDATIGQSAASGPTAPSTSGVDDDTVSGPPCSRPITPRLAPSGTISGIYNPKPKVPAHAKTREIPDWIDGDAGEEDKSIFGGGRVDNFRTQHYNTFPPTRQHYERQCSRSVLLSRLAENTTHGDITEAVRGGPLLDIYLRSNDRIATVSFLRGADAKAFFDHVKRYDLYINHKRVDIRWSDRQFILPGHIASKIVIGATRNLVMRRCDPQTTEQSIRDDLDHIHNLAVIKVEFIGGGCYIRTNYVQNAMFARTCMMSRAKYKGCKIDWDVDECNQPLVTPQPKPRYHTPTSRNNSNTMANRFDLLNLDDEGDAFLPPYSVANTMVAA